MNLLFILRWLARLFAHDEERHAHVPAGTRKFIK
jgi:hypothetical protein